jgi:hypothetical protein
MDELDELIQESLREATETQMHDFAFNFDENIDLEYEDDELEEYEDLLV